MNAIELHSSGAQVTPLCTVSCAPLASRFSGFIPTPRHVPVGGFDWYVFKPVVNVIHGVCVFCPANPIPKGVLPPHAWCSRDILQIFSDPDKDND